MLSIEFEIEEKLNPWIEGWCAEINPYNARRICIKSKNNIIAAIDIPKDVDIRTVEISVTNMESNSIADKELLRIEAACMVDSYNYHSILTGYVTTKYKEEVVIKIRKMMFTEEEGIEIII